MMGAFSNIALKLKLTEQQLMMALLPGTGYPSAPPITTAFDSNNAGIMNVGTTSTGSYGPDTGGVTKTYRWVGNDILQSEVQFRAYARKITLSWLPLGSNSVKVYVDGSLALTIPAAGTWGTFTILDVGSDGYHDVRINSDSFNTQFPENTGTITLVGSAPALIYPPNFSNPLYPGFASNYVVNDGSCVSISTSGYFSYGWYRFKATTSRIKVFGYGGAYSLYQDGVFLRNVEQTAGSYQWLDLGATDGTAEHEYWIRGDAVINNRVPQGLGYLYRISADGMNTASMTAKDLWMFFGDSITWGYGATGSCRNIYEQIFTNTRGVASINLGINGKKLTEEYQNVIDAATARNPKKVCINFGHNDLGDSISTFKNRLYDMLHGLCAISSITNIYYPGIIDYAGDVAGRVTINTAIQSICTGGADGSARTLAAPEIAKITYLNTDGVVTSFYDGIHPDDTGYAQFGAFLLANIP